MGFQPTNLTSQKHVLTRKLQERMSVEGVLSSSMVQKGMQQCCDQEENEQKGASTCSPTWKHSAWSKFSFTFKMPHWYISVILLHLAQVPTELLMQWVGESTEKVVESSLFLCNVVCVWVWCVLKVNIKAYYKIWCVNSFSNLGQGGIGSELVV